jgi:hypothetical protein
LPMHFFLAASHLLSGAAFAVAPANANDDTKDRSARRERGASFTSDLRIAGVNETAMR